MIMFHVILYREALYEVYVNMSAINKSLTIFPMVDNDDWDDSSQVHVMNK